MHRNYILFLLILLISNSVLPETKNNYRIELRDGRNFSIKLKSFNCYYERDFSYFKTVHDYYKYIGPENSITAVQGDVWYELPLEQLKKIERVGVDRYKLENPGNIKQRLIDKNQYLCTGIHSGNFWLNFRDRNPVFKITFLDGKVIYANISDYLIGKILKNSALVEYKADFAGIKTITVDERSNRGISSVEIELLSGLIQKEVRNVQCIDKRWDLLSYEKMKIPSIIFEAWEKYNYLLGENSYPMPDHLEENGGISVKLNPIQYNNRDIILNSVHPKTGYFARDSENRGPERRTNIVISSVYSACTSTIIII